MELILLAQFIKRWWYVVAIPLVLAVLWSLPAVPDALFPPATYGASMRFVAAAPPDAVQAIAAEEDALPRSGSYEDTAYVPWLASEYVVVNLPSWVTSERFAAEVSAVLADAGHDIPADEVRRALNADSARSIMTVYFGWDDEAELAAIIAATVEVLQTRNQAYFPQFALEPAQIVPLDNGTINQTFPPLSARFAPFIRIALGLGVGLGLAAVASYLDDRVYSAEDVQATGLAVLAVIPKE